MTLQDLLSSRGPYQDPKRRSPWATFTDDLEPMPPNQMDMGDMSWLMKLFYAILGYQDSS